MTHKILIVGAVLLLLSMNTDAQRRTGNAGGQRGQSAQHGSLGQTGQGRMSGTTTRDQQRDQQRLRLHVTDQQRQHLKSCTQSTERIRTRTRTMSKLSKNSTLTAQQAQQWREQLRTELQNMNQNHEQLMAGLSAEQKTASSQTVQEIEQSRSRLLQSAEILDSQLMTQLLDMDQIRDRAHDTERAAIQLKQSQDKLSEQLD